MREKDNDVFRFYAVVSRDGATIFSRTFEEHVAAKEKYLRVLRHW